MTFADYVLSFYGPGEIYGHFFNNTLTRKEVEVAIKERLEDDSFPFDGDFADRERVRDIMEKNRQIN